jgi:hypothetical protein
MKSFDAIQDVLIAFFPLSIDSFAKHFRAIRIQRDAFDFRAAKINAESKHKCVRMKSGFFIRVSKFFDKAARLATDFALRDFE